MKKVSECLEYLAETDERFGQLKASAKYYAEYKVKQVKSQEFINAKGSSNPEREAISMLTLEVDAVYREKRDVDAEMETIAAKRKTAELTIEVWRSQNANKRQGVIT